MQRISFSRAASTFFALSLSLLGATSAWAGTLTVDFDLSRSFLRLNDEFTLAEGVSSGTAIDGSLRLTVTGVNAFGELTGPEARARISDLALTFDLALGDVSASILIAQDPNPSPFIDFFGGVAFDPELGSELRISITGSIDCIGGPQLCTFFEPPNRIALPIAFDTLLTGAGGAVSFDLGFLGLRVPGESGISASLQGMQGTQPVGVMILGREVARAFVPEPAEVHTLGIGILALALADGLRRRRRPSHPRSSVSCSPA